MPANPVSSDVIILFGENEQTQMTGLTKREAFAMAAMQGLSTDINDYAGKAWANDMAVNAVNIADALLAELEK